MDGIKQGVAFADQIIDEAGTLCNDYQTEEAQKKVIHWNSAKMNFAGI